NPGRENPAESYTGLRRPSTRIHSACVARPAAKQSAICEASSEKSRTSTPIASRIAWKAICQMRASRGRRSDMALLRDLLLAIAQAPPDALPERGVVRPEAILHADRRDIPAGERSER